MYVFFFFLFILAYELFPILIDYFDVAADNLIVFLGHLYLIFLAG